MILAIETATNICSVALGNRSRNIFEKRYEERGSHSEQLFLFIESLMEEHQFDISDLEALLFSEGPGSYTGLRIGASGAKGLLFNTEVPFFTINTLASFAMSAAHANHSGSVIHSIIDARRAHIYHQSFTTQPDGRLVSDDSAELVLIEEFESMIEQDNIIIGTGMQRIDKSVLKKAILFDSDSISADSLIHLYQNGKDDFVKKANPSSFSPKYYSSNQINNSPIG